MAKTPEEKAADKAAKQRKDLIKDLAQFGITETSGTPTIAPLSGQETNEKLVELLTAAKAEAGATQPAPEPETAKGDITVKYRDHKGEPTERTFSKDVHGKDFAKLAEEFKTTNASRIIA